MPRGSARYEHDADLGNTGPSRGQPEVEAYLNFVADRLDLRRDIQFDTKVVAMTFDERDYASVAGPAV